MEKIIFSKEKRNKIRYPLGGIGTGCLFVSGRGEPLSLSLPNNEDPDITSSFSVRFAFKTNCAGISHTKMLYDMQNDSMEFEFPYASFDYRDDKMPVKFRMTAFNPFIPEMIADSSIPAAFFDFTLENESDNDAEAVVCCVADSPFRDHKNYFDVDSKANARFISMTDNDPHTDDPASCGMFAISTDYEEISYYQNFSLDDGALVKWLNEIPYFPSVRTPQSDGKRCALDAHVFLKPKETAHVRFLVSWLFNSIFNKWTPITENIPENEIRVKNRIKTFNSNFFKSNEDVAEYCFKHWDSLDESTRLFSKTVLVDSLPKQVLFAASVNLCAYKLPNAFIDIDGMVYLIDNECVKGRQSEYDFVFPKLFPDRERRKRTFEFTSLTDRRNIMRYCTTSCINDFNGDDLFDSIWQYISVLKLYREFVGSGDTDFLRQSFEKASDTFNHVFRRENMSLTDIFFMQSRKACAILASLFCLCRMSKILKMRRYFNRYSKAYDEFKSAFDKFSSDTYSESQLAIIAVCTAMGADEPFKKSRVTLSLERLENFEDSFTLAYLFAYHGFFDRSLSLLEKLNKKRDGENECPFTSTFTDGLFSENVFSYCLIDAFLGLRYDMFTHEVVLDPHVSKRSDSTYEAGFYFASCMGTVERGVDYLDLKMLSGEMTLSRLTISDEPFVVLYAGRRLCFYKDGKTVIFQGDLDVSREKDLSIWI